MNPRPLPGEAEHLTIKKKASPRLHAHLVLVHDVACQLTEQVSRDWPDLMFDEKAVHTGAAIHDIGKTAYPSELSKPARLHEHAGRKLLLEHGWPAELARFSVTHGDELGVNDPLEDLLVATADKAWKGKREDALEQALVHRIATVSDQESWQVWMILDDILTQLSEAAPERLSWQATMARGSLTFPVM